MLKKITSYIFPALLFSVIWGVSSRALDVFQKVKGVSTTLSSSEIISLTNLQRSKYLVPALHPNQPLTRAAHLKAQDMFERGYFDHIDIDGNGSWKIIENEGYVYLHAGENLARNFNSASSLVDAWMKSDAHRTNMLSKNYSDIGIAVLEKGNQVYIVQLLAAPIPHGYIDLPDTGENFSFSKPLSGSAGMKSNSRAATIISFIFSLLIFYAGYRSISKITHKHLKFKIPDIKYWHRK